MLSFLQNRETTACLALLRLSQLCASLRPSLLFRDTLVSARGTIIFRLSDFRVVSHALGLSGSVLVPRVFLIIQFRQNRGAWARSVLAHSSQ